LADMGKVK